MVENEELIPKFTHKIPIQLWRGLPKTMALYGVFSSRKLLYIGISWNLRNRFINHHKQEKFIENNATEIKYKLYTIKEQLHDDEYSYLKKYKPPLNIRVVRQFVLRPGTQWRIEKQKSFTKPFTLYQMVYELIWEFITSGESMKASIQDLSLRADVNEAWIRAFVRNKIPNPSVNTIEGLYVVLTGHDLKV